jgi:hypothetical protein
MGTRDLIKRIGSLLNSTVTERYHQACRGSKPEKSVLLGFLVCVLLFYPSSGILAQSPTINGLYYGDNDQNLYVQYNTSGFGSTLWYSFSDNTLFVALVVDRSVNDNVFGNREYTQNAGWGPPHTANRLTDSEYASFTLTIGSQTYIWNQGYAALVGGEWVSNNVSGAGTGTAPPGYISSSSFVWNITNYEMNPSPNWDMYVNGTTINDWKSPFETSDPDVVVGLDGYPATGPIVYSPYYQWEWPMVYEWSADLSSFGPEPIFVISGQSHHSPSKNGNEDDPFPEPPGNQYLTDYGDLPEPYATLLNDAGAHHYIVANGAFLGVAVDPEPDGQPDINALGDDNSGINDEDGVVLLTPIVPGSTAVMQITAGTAGFLSIFIDWDNNGSLDPVTLVSAVGPAPVSPGILGDTELAIAGTYDLTIQVPANAQSLLHARFRFTNSAGDGGNSPVDLALTGEVEDYIFEALLATPTPTFTPEPPTETPTFTPIPPTETPTPEPTDTPVPTDTPTPEPTDTPVPTDTPTPEPTDTPVPTDTPTPEPTDTPVPTDTPTPEPTDTPVPPTETPTFTPIPPTETPTQEPTDTPVPTDTPTPEPTDTPVPTDTPTPEPTDTPVPPTETPTFTPIPPTETPTPEPTDTPVPTDTPTPEPTDTPVPTDTPTPEPTDTPVPTDTPTPEPTDTPVPTDTPTPEPTVTATETPVPTMCPNNLVENPGFENWTLFGPSGPPDAWLIDGFELEVYQEDYFVFDGDFSAGFYWMQLENQSLYQEISIAEGYNYDIRLRYYDESLGGDIILRLEWLDELGSIIGLPVESPLSGLTSGWETIEYLSETAPGGAVTLRYSIVVYGYWDDYLIAVDNAEVCGDLPTPTETPAPTDTPTPVPTDTPLPTDTPTPEPTDTPVPTDTPTPEPTDTPVPTGTPTLEPTDTPVPTDTPTPVPTDTPLPTDTPTPEPTDTPVPTDSPTPVPTGTPAPTYTPVPTDTPTPVPTNTPTAQPPTATPTPLPPTSTPTSQPTATPTCSELTIYPYEITFDPPSAEPGDIVNITAIVHNTGTIIVNYSELRFAYEQTPFDPSDDPNPVVIGDPFIIENLPAGEFTEAHVIWDTTGLDQASYPIYVWTSGTLPEECDPGKMTQTDYLVPVILNRFETFGFDGSVRLEWTTETEINNLGFHVYRSETYFEDYVQVTEKMIPGAGTSFTLHDYFWIDMNVINGNPYFYKLQMIDGSGDVTWSPVMAGVPNEKGIHTVFAGKSGQTIYNETTPLLLYARVNNPQESIRLELSMILIVNASDYGFILPPVEGEIPARFHYEGLLWNYAWSGMEPEGWYTVVSILKDVTTGELINLYVCDFRFIRKSL